MVRRAVAKLWKPPLRGMFFFSRTRRRGPSSVQIRAPRRRPHRGHGARPRHPLHRHQPALRHGGVALRQPVLREGPGREPDQAAQDSARLGPDLVPLGAGQPDAPCAAHRRLLADAHRARRHPQATRSRHSRVRHVAAAPAEGRRPKTTSRVRLAFAAACPEAELFRSLPSALWPSAP